MKAVTKSEDIQKKLNEVVRLLSTLEKKGNRDRDLMMRIINKQAGIIGDLVSGFVWPAIEVSLLSMIRELEEFKAPNPDALPQSPCSTGTGAALPD